MSRGPAEITKTRLGGVVIAPTHEAAQRTLRAVASHAGMPADRLRAMITVGDPDTVAEQASELLDAGFDGLVFNMPNVHELKKLALLGSTLSPLLAARAQGRS